LCWIDICRENVETNVKRKGILLSLGIILAMLLAACEGLPVEIPWLVDDVPTPTTQPDDADQITPTPETPPETEATLPPVTSLTLWVPPEMDPDLETAASALFADRLAAFAEINGVEINLRVKAASGAGGLLDALTASSAAAPDTLPDLIALSRPDLETAALKGLIFSMDGMTESPDDADWYGFTRAMALIQGSTFGLPFAADALALVYRAETTPERPESWAELFETGLVLAYPAEHDQSLFPMALYLAEGGLLQDTQRRPQLELDPLTEVYRLMEAGVEAGTFPDWLAQYQTSGQVWTAFKDGQVDFAVTWVSDVLKESPEDATLVPIYPGTEGGVSLGTGMSWALASAQEHRHPMAVALAEYLVEPEFLAEWTLAAGYIPTRPSSLQVWQNQRTRSTINQIALMTVLRPSNDVVLSLGPLLREGSRQVLQGAVDPAQAAQQVIETLGDQ
jgi:ABC-type glycerol-3-phosphate transport system substrate-binding protein